MIECIWKDADNRTRVTYIEDKYAALTYSNFIDMFTIDSQIIYRCLCDFFEENYMNEIDRLESIDNYPCDVIANHLTQVSRGSYWSTDLSYLRPGR